MHIVTGGAGFIGSAFVAKLNEQGVSDIIVVDEKDSPARKTNLAKLRYVEFIDKVDFINLIKNNSLSSRFPGRINSVVHMGACSSTTEKNWQYLLDNNYGYTMRLANYCLERDIRFVYASSAATYGAGEQGFSDDDEITPQLRPINLYGQSKQNLDLWAISNGLNKKMVGLKFFNVYGPNEYHKGGQRSVVHRAYGQIKTSGEVKLFKSYKPEFADGTQRRDFIYVKDCTDAMWWLVNNHQVNGIFNLGTGQSRTWLDLAQATFAALGLQPRISFIDMPDELRYQYQYFTEAKMGKFLGQGYPGKLTPLEDGVRDYVLNYLENNESCLCGGVS